MLANLRIWIEIFTLMTYFRGSSNLKQKYRVSLRGICIDSIDLLSIIYYLSIDIYYLFNFLIDFLIEVPGIIYPTISQL